MSNNIEKEDTLTVSRVYENLRSPTFLKNLYWDILSGIKEKNTYKLMRGMTEKLINQNMDYLNGLNNSKADNTQRKKIVAEICAMSYAIDTVFSKILYRKLEKACKGQMLNIIQQLKNEGKIPENVWSKFRINQEGSEAEAETSSEQLVTETDPTHEKREIQKTQLRVGRRKRKVVSNPYLEDIKKSNSNKEILDDLKKVNGVKTASVNQNSVNSKKGSFSPKKLTGRTKDFSKRNASDPEPEPSTSFNKLTKENLSLLDSLRTSVEDALRIPKDFFHTDNQDVSSDTDSEISFGPRTVSSVNTSDLSSFDDEISLSSDDESGKRKKISLKELQKKFCKSSKSDSSIALKSDVKSSKTPESKAKPGEEVVEDAQKKNKEKPSEEVVEDTQKKNKVSVDDTPVRSQLETASFPSPNENGLPKRTRKPNSRYSSDSIICTAVKVKEKKKLFSNMSNSNGKMPGDELTHQKKKSKVDNDIIGDVNTITQSINNEGSNYVTPPKREPATPNSCKSYSANRSLTSRKTAPVTLFST